VCVCARVYIHTQQRVYATRVVGPTIIRAQHHCWSVSGEYLLEGNTVSCLIVVSASADTEDLGEGARWSWNWSCSLNSMLTYNQIDEHMMYLLYMLTKSYTGLFFIQNYRKFCYLFLALIPLLYV